MLPYLSLSIGSQFYWHRGPPLNYVRLNVQLPPRMVFASSYSKASCPLLPRWGVLFPYPTKMLLPGPPIGPLDFRPRRPSSKDRPDRQVGPRHILLPVPQRHAPYNHRPLIIGAPDLYLFGLGPRLPKVPPIHDAHILGRFYPTPLPICSLRRVPPWHPFP